LTNWTAGNAENQVVGQFTAAQRAEYSGLRTDLAVNAAAATQLDVCYSPLGRAVFRTNQNGAFASLTNVPVIRVFRLNTSGLPYGLARRVLIQPSGNTQVGEAEVL
jgi:hypothetical protein